MKSLAKARSAWPLWTLLVLLLAAVGPELVGTRPAGAQTSAPQSTRARLELIRERMEQGQALYLAGKYAEAAKIFEEGYKDYPYSAFLFNAGVTYQKLKDYQRAIEKFRAYLSADPRAPDAEKVKERIRSLEAAQAALAPPSMGAAGADAGPPDAGPVADAGTPPAVLPSDDDAAMKSLVVIETEPQGAPIKLYRRENQGAAPFKYGAENPGWKLVASPGSPTNLTLDVGTYHIVVEKFRGFNVSETDIHVSPGHVHHFKANLSQGAFMGFLRVNANVPGAYIFLDDPERQRPPWGRIPHGELVSPGEHSIVVEAPGFEPLLQKFTLKTSEQKEIDVELVRLGYGMLRIDSNAAAIRVSVDDKPVGTWASGEAPLQVQLQSGRHRLRVEADDRKTLEADVDVPRGQVLPLRANMIPTYPRGTAWTQAVIAAAFVGAGVYFGVESNRLHDELEADRARGVLDSGDSRITQGRWFAIGSNAGFAIGGVLAALSTYNFIKDPLPESSTREKGPVEFDDPRAQRPTAARLPLPHERRQRHVERRPKRTRASTAQSSLHVAPGIGEHGAGLLIGGSF